MIKNLELFGAPTLPPGWRYSVGVTLDGRMRVALQRRRFGWWFRVASRHSTPLWIGTDDEPLETTAARMARSLYFAEVVPALTGEV